MDSQVQLALERTTRRACRLPEERGEGREERMSEVEGSQDSLRISRVFPATRQRTFRAWTDTNELKKWWRVGKEFVLTVAEIDLRVGGGFRIGVESPSGSMHMVRGRFLEVVPPERLVYTWIAEDPNLKQMGTLVTVEVPGRGDRAG